MKQSCARKKYSLSKTNPSIRVDTLDDLGHTIESENLNFENIHFSLSNDMVLQEMCELAEAVPMMP